MAHTEVETKSWYLRSVEIRERAASWVRTLPVDEKKPLRLVAEPTKRSKPQNAKMHALIGRLIASGFQWHERSLDKTEWKILFSAKLFGQEVMPNLENTGFVAIGYHTSEMSEEEASMMIELILYFCAEHQINLGPEVENIDEHGVQI